MNPASLDSAKDRLRIPSLAGMYFPNWTAGVSCRSPFREDRNNSFSVFDEGRRFKDFATGESGDAIDFLQRAAGLDTAAAIAEFKRLAGCDEPARNTAHFTAPPAPARTATAKPAKMWQTVKAAAEGCTPAGHTLADVYDYQRNGEPFAAVARYEGESGKTFRQYHFTGGAWTTGKPSEKWPLFLIDGIGAGVAYICEGEKTTLAGLGIGLNCTCSAGGSNGANSTDWRPLAGRDIVILPDSDSPGEMYAGTVAGILQGIGCSVRILRLPGLPAAGDLVEYLDANPAANAAEIERQAALVTPEAVPLPTPASAADGTPQRAAGLSPIEAAAAGTPYACTDLGNAERFAFMHRDSVRFDAARRVWLVWDRRRWKPDTALEANQLAAETARAIRLEAAAVPADGEQGRKTAENLFRHAIRTEARDRLAALLDVARSQPGLAVSPAELDRDDFLLNCENGTLDLRTGTLKPHDRADLLTRLSPVAFVPGKHDPRFDAFIHDATGADADLRQFLQKLCGYLLTGDTREEKAFFWYGGTSTGKSTLLEGMRAALGDYARTINPAMLCKQTNTNSGAATPELAALHGCRLAAGSELESGQQLGEAFMKSLTGGEGITARHLYGAQFEFMPTFKIVLAVNHCPRASADDSAVWRRLVRVGIDKTVPPERMDRTLKPYLRNPAGGAVALLAWAVAGCLAWQREGLEPLPVSVRRNTAEYRNECDPLAAFIEDRITVAARYAWTATADIWAAYTEHATEQGTPERYRVSPRRLADRLKECGAVAERRHEGRGWLGVELKGETETGAA